MRPAADHQYFGVRSILDDRMVEVRQLLREGLSNAKIAKRLGVDDTTVGDFIRGNNLARPILGVRGEYVEPPKPAPPPPPFVRPFEPVAEGSERVISLSVVDCVAGGAAWAGVPVSEFVSELRTRRISRPRQFAMHLAREMTDASLPRIGKLFGRDHTTVLHAQRFVRKALANEPEATTLLTEIHRYAAAHALRRAASNMKAAAELRGEAG